MLSHISRSSPFKFSRFRLEGVNMTSIKHGKNTNEEDISTFSFTLAAVAVCSKIRKKAEIADSTFNSVFPIKGKISSSLRFPLKESFIIRE